jgi:hypothetical protein
MCPLNLLSYGGSAAARCHPRRSHVWGIRERGSCRREVDVDRLGGRSSTSDLAGKAAHAGNSYTVEGATHSARGVSTWKHPLQRSF